MPSKIEYYICDACLRTYDTYEEAYKCELDNSTPLKWIYHKHPVDGITKPIVKLNE